MDKFALIGKGISHSRSPELYKKFIGPHITYDLLDIALIEDLPSIESLSEKYCGINITAPWKEYYAQYAVKEAKEWGAVNCLRFKNHRCEATNTDASALKELIPQIKSEFSAKEWVVLGDGVMGRMMMKLLEDLGEKVKNYSRRKGDELNQINFNEIHSENQTKILVNACGRSFNFEGNLGGTWVFWDLNYAHKVHEQTLPSRVRHYIDGFSLLETQARHAVIFWESQE